MSDKPAALPFKKLLIACRGAAALRVLRACRELGLPAAVAYSEPDRDALPTMLADEAVCIGPAPEADSYANLSRVLSAAEITRCDALHAGDGPLAANPEFIDAAGACGVAFIGPDAESARRLSDRLLCRELARAAGVPVVPGSDGETPGPAEAATAAERLGYPVLCRPATGHSPRRVVRRDRDLEPGLRLCQAEARSATGDGRVYIERLLERCRRLRVPVLADATGAVAALVERDLSVQFRRRVLIDESPSPAVGPELRARLLAAAEEAARALDYRRPGAVDFLLESDDRFYFAGAGVRHGPDEAATEMLTGLDWTAAAIRAAAGQEIVADSRQRAAPAEGHVMQACIAAENPDAEFERTSGLVTEARLPGGPGVRTDGYITPGYEVPPVYDPLLCTVTVRAGDRQRAIARLARCLTETTISGPKTTLGLLRRILAGPRLERAELHCAALEEELG